MSRLRAASRRRAKSIGALVLLALLGAVLAACGHYGPPVRTSRAKSEATATAPAAPAQPAPDKEHPKDE